MALGIAMIGAYIPVFWWIYTEVRKELVEKKEKER